ncbi:zinc finger, CCHC-type containing protein [Tanacetum coccineum]
MKSYGDQINEEAVVSKVLRSLSSKFNHVVAAIEEAHDLSSYSFDELMSSLLAHEDRLNSAQEQTEEKVFQVKGDSSSKGIVESSDFRGNNRGGYHGRGRGRGKGGRRSKSDESQNRNPIQLRNCNKYGHKDVDCWSKPKSGSIHCHVESSKELWDTLEANYISEDASSKKFLEDLTLIELDSHLRIEESLRMQYSNKPKGNNVTGPSVINMVEHNNSFRYNDNKGKRKHYDTTADPNKKSKMTCWKCGKPRHLKKDCKGGKASNKANASGTNGSDDDVAWWVESRATVNVCKDRCWFKTYESLNAGSILHMGNESTWTWLNIINDNIALSFMSTSKLNDSILWHARLGHVHFKRMQDMSKDGAFDMDTKKDEALDIFKVFKTKVELKQRSQIKRFKTDRGVPRPGQRSLINVTEDIVGLVVPEEVTEEVVHQPEPELRKSKRNRTPKIFRHEFQLYLIEGTRDWIFDQHFCCFNVEDDPKTSDEAMKS